MKMLIKLVSILCIGLLSMTSFAATIGPCQEDACVRYFKEYKKYAKAGYADAMTTLGDLYYYGHGTKSNLKKALKQYRKAAKYGSIKGQYKAAMMYMNNPEFSDLDKGVKYLKKAARSNSTDAAFLLGVIYFKKDFYERDFDEADKWLTIAYEGGHKKIGEFIGYMKTSENASAKDFPDLWAVIDKDPGLVEAAEQAKAEASANASTPKLTREQRENIETITVTADLHNLFDAQLAGLKNTYPDKGGVTTGSRIIGQSCAKMLACASVDMGEYNRLVSNIMGSHAVAIFYP